MNDAPLVYRASLYRHVIATCTGSGGLRTIVGGSCWHVVCAVCRKQVGVEPDGAAAEWYSHRGAVARLARHLRDVHGEAL